MYLKAIEVENFKSFGRKTRLEFREGFTAISGPNGSGKSNITDAILFVLGPKSSKKIRAQRLTDLIYNGGKNGRPADYCKVSLIFDNRDRVLPIDEDEVKLTRYIKRASNEEGYNSYFYINEEKARLQDFNSILIHAKISADGYNFVQQGDVTRIVEMTPLERRTILDDIAGITKFDNEIKKAENERRATEENMEKIKVLLDEIERRIEELKRDREMALKYKELEEKLTLTKAKIAYSNMVSAETRVESIEKQIANLSSEISALDEKIREMRGKEEEVRARIEEVDRKMEELGQGELARMRDRIDELKVEYARVRMGIENREERIQELQDRMEEIKEALKEMKGEKKRVEEELSKAKSRKDEIEGKWKEKKDALERKEKEIGEANKRFGQIQEEISSKMDELEELRREYNSASQKESKITAEIERIRREIASKEEEIKDYESSLKDAEWRLKELKGESKGVEKERKELEKKYYELKNEETRVSKLLREKEKEVSQLSVEYEKVKARMEASTDSLSRAAMAVLEARDRGELKGIYGTIAELGNVKDEYSTAIEIAAGNRMMSIVCEDDEAAARAIEFLKRRRLGRAIFLPLNKMLRGRPRGKAHMAARDPHAVGFAIDLIDFDPKFEAAFWYVFGDTVIVDNLENARKLMGGVRLVTLDGQLIEASGAMVGGSVERRKRVSMGNLDEIGRRLREATEERDSLRMKLDAIRDELDSLMNRIRSIQVNDNTKEIEVWENERRRFKERIKATQEKIDSLKKEMEEYSRLLASTRRDMDLISEKITKVEREIEKLKEESSKLIPENISREISQLKEEVSQLYESLKEESSNIAKLEENLRGLGERIGEKEKEVERIEKEISQLIKEIEEERERGKEIEMERKKLEEVLSREQEKVRGLMEERDKLSKEIERIRAEISKARSDRDVKEQLIIHTRSNLDAEKRKYQEAREEYESFGIQVDKVEAVSKLRRILDDVEAQMRSMGPVNMKSIEDYDREKERYEKLMEEYRGLKEERKHLMDLVKELNGRKKDGLMKVFNAINENFKRIYSEISNGGEAYLMLENEEDPFKGGLVIKVKPVGKKFIRLESLSGGEKSLTALAFIFAIQQYDPSPFYVLDEVDMFLDGVNAEMVGRVIKRNSRTAQFIVISLRKATLKFADYIIGVTQQGDGLSRVFLQKVPEEVSENAA